jgi:hypothetical protein
MLAGPVKSLDRIHVLNRQVAAQQQPPLLGLYTDEPSRLSYLVVVYDFVASKKTFKITP